jgi:hypothetical protein
MYQARLHPEQYSNTFSDIQVKQLHDAMMYVCNTAVDALAESEKFPEDWLMRHRWDKGKKNGGKLPNGAKITFLKVGGRTSAVVPSVQKKTGAVAGDVSEDANDDEEVEEPKAGRKRKSKPVKDEEDEEQVEATRRSRTKRGKKKVDADELEDGEEEKVPAAKKQKVGSNGTARKKKSEDEPAEIDGNGRRRSGRLSKT